MKKIVSVLFVLVLMLSLGSLDVYAKGARTAIAYLPLVSAGGQAGPAKDAGAFSLEAHQAYLQLAPRLEQARKTGQVLRYKPEFSAGLVMVEYTAGTDLATLLRTGQPAFASSHAALAFSGAGQAAFAGQPRPAVVAPYIELYTDGDDGYYAGGMGANDTYAAYLDDASSRLVGYDYGTADGSGEIEDGFDGIWEGTLPGYTFTLQIFNPSGTTLLDTYSVVIPNLGTTSINPSARTAQGTAPNGANVSVELYHYLLDGTGHEQGTLKTATANHAGNWKVDFSPMPLRGGDEVEVYWVKPSSVFSFYEELDAPALDCGLGMDYCYSYGAPGAPAKITIKHGHASYVFTGNFYDVGYFEAYLSGRIGAPVYLAAGDQVSAPGLSRLTLPRITAVPNYATGVVSGAAPANRWVDVDLDVYNPVSGWFYYRKWALANSGGVYSADFSGAGFNTSDFLYIYVYYKDPSNGNATDFENLIAPILS
ncbi:MAG: hypothetical protein WCE68_01765 [Anaerolineales bacterium]